MTWVAQTLTPALDSDSDSRVTLVPTVLRNPVCRVFTSQYESILMTKPAGRTLAQVWWDLLQPAREHIVRQLARIYAAAFRNPLRSIGNLHPNCGVATSLLRPYEENAKRSLDLCYRLSKLIDRYFPPEVTNMNSDSDTMITKPQAHQHDQNGNGNENRSLEVLQPPSPARPLSSDAEPTVITHSGLTRSTIFVDAQNNISGIEAWDCATALPLWEACQLPLFLILPSSTSSDPPNRRDFKHDVNGYPVAAYWVRLQEYQLACLADVFLAEMRVVCPEWARLCTDDPLSRARRDLSRAICLVTVGAAKMAVESWVGAAERGDEDEMRRLSLTGMGLGIGLKSGKGVGIHN
ncbi:hypothetical protein F5X96DRAFT_630994 [Biscogniauxia mediterranea]|nr:hypothetical protein F5X96DRAFT_630994 [Biscogniauxia mediterranea]